MAFMRSAGRQWRPVAIRNAFIIAAKNGLLVAQRWPRSRGRTLNPHTTEMNEVWRAITRVMQTMPQWQWDTWRQALQRHRETHRGQRGSAAIRDRDWITQILMGRGPAFTLPDGRTIYPAAVRRDASGLLDNISATPGALLTRSHAGWDGLAPCPPGTRLTSTPNGGYPWCCSTYTTTD